MGRKGNLTNAERHYYRNLKVRKDGRPTVAALAGLTEAGGWPNYAASKQSKKRNWCKKNNLPFDLTLAFIRSFFDGQCHYCGARGRMEMDRVVPSLGYVMSNTVPACAPCNQVKSSHLSVEETRAVVSLVASMRGKRHESVWPRVTRYQGGSILR